MVELSSEATRVEGDDFRWVLSVDGSSNQQGSGVGVILEGPNGVLIEQSLRFAFKASNNQAEYEALIAGILLAKEMGARVLILPVDRSAGECLVKGSTCAPLLTSVPPLDLSQEPANKRYGAAAADRTPTLKSVTVSPNTKNWNRANSLSHKQLCHSQA